MPESAYIQNVKLTTVHDCIDFMEHLIKGYLDRLVSETDLRATVYAMKQLLEFQKHRDNVELLDRLDEIERRLDAMGK